MGEPALVIRECMVSISIPGIEVDIIDHSTRAENSPSVENTRNSIESIDMGSNLAVRVETGCTIIVMNTCLESSMVPLFVEEAMRLPVLWA